jgi:hypothetical protein
MGQVEKRETETVIDRKRAENVGERRNVKQKEQERHFVYSQRVAC